MMASLRRRLKLKLREGELVCPDCKGSGYIYRNPRWGVKETVSCPLCGSDGKVDWIRNIIGPDPRMPQQYWLDESYARKVYDWFINRMKYERIRKI